MYTTRIIEVCRAIGALTDAVICSSQEKVSRCWAILYADAFIAEMLAGKALRRVFGNHATALTFDTAQSTCPSGQIERLADWTGFHAQSPSTAKTAGLARAGCPSGTTARASWVTSLAHTVPIDVGSVRGTLTGAIAALDLEGRTDAYTSTLS